MSKYLLAPIFKVFVMFFGIASLQLTHTLFSKEIFISFNAIIFAIGFHTCTTYSTQVKIWEGGTPLRIDYLLAGLYSLAIVFVIGLVGNVSVTVAVAMYFFLVAKFLERICFNKLLNDGEVLGAYKILIFLVILEVVVFLTTHNYFLEEYSRFLLPSLIVCIFAVTISLRTMKAANKNTIRASGSGLQYSIHSFFILAVLMLDRLIPSLWAMQGAYSSENYLLLFSYCSAFYAIGVSILEVMRPKLFSVARDSKNLSIYFKNTKCNLVVILCLIYFLLQVLIGYVAVEILKSYNFEIPENTMEIWIGLSGFFSSFLLLAYFQVYFLSGRVFQPLFVSWSIAFGLRSVGFFSGSWSLVVVFSFFSGLAAIAWLFYSQRHEKYWV